MYISGGHMVIVNRLTFIFIFAIIGVILFHRKKRVTPVVKLMIGCIGLIIFTYFIY